MASSQTHPGTSLPSFGSVSFSLQEISQMGLDVDPSPRTTSPYTRSLEGHEPNSVTSNELPDSGSRNLIQNGEHTQPSSTRILPSPKIRTETDSLQGAVSVPTQSNYHHFFGDEQSYRYNANMQPGSFEHQAAQGTYGLPFVGPISYPYYPVIQYQVLCVAASKLHHCCGCIDIQRCKSALDDSCQDSSEQPLQDISAATQDSYPISRRRQETCQRQVSQQPCHIVSQSNNARHESGGSENSSAEYQSQSVNPEYEEAPQPDPTVLHSTFEKEIHQTSTEISIDSQSNGTRDSQRGVREKAKPGISTKAVNHKPSTRALQRKKRALVRGGLRTLPADLEERIVKNAISSQGLGSPLTRGELLEMAQKALKDTGDHRSIGTVWLGLFMKRHHELSLNE